MVFKILLSLRVFVSGVRVEAYGAIGRGICHYSCAGALREPDVCDRS